ncbi:MAG: peroxide stress protein YaaA [Pseudomonadota bacterium]
MLTVISPAKSLDYETPTVTEAFTQPEHLTQSRKLIRRLRQLSKTDISKLMSVSDSLAELNHDRYKKWKTPFKPENARQALFAFKGDVYLGLDAYSMHQQDIDFAQNHLRILSGLYGLLKPLDLMQPYRLEMGTRLDTDAGTNLYHFWNGRITKSLNQELKQSGSNTLINLASNEYFKSVQLRALKADVITPAFKEFHKGEYRFIQFHAKKARGYMSRFIIDEQINDAESLRDFDREGYRFDAKQSNDQEWVFTRKQ